MLSTVPTQVRTTMRSCNQINVKLAAEPIKVCGDLCVT